MDTFTRMSLGEHRNASFGALEQLLTCEEFLDCMIHPKKNRHVNQDSTIGELEWHSTHQSHLSAYECTGDCIYQNATFEQRSQEV